MKWIINKFGFIISIVFLILGIWNFPIDIQDSQQAVPIWQKIFSTRNREYFLFFLVVVLSIRLFYIDFRRSINDQDWPPVHRKLLHFMAFFLKKDARIAQFKVISDDEALKYFHISLLARKIVEQTDWNPIKPLPLPYADSRDDYKNMANPGDDIYYALDNVGMLENRISDIFQELLISYDNIGLSNSSRTHISQISKRLKDQVISAKEAAYTSRSQWEDIEKGKAFYSDELRRRWHETRCQINMVNRLLPEVKAELVRLQDLWKQMPDAEAINKILKIIDTRKFAPELTD